MSAHLAQMIRTLSPDGLQIHIWPSETHGFQVNVSEKSGKAWTVEHGSDPVAALEQALRFRATGSAERAVVVDVPLKTHATDKSDPWPADPRQIDLEEVIAATLVADEFEGLL